MAQSWAYETRPFSGILVGIAVLVVVAVFSSGDNNPMFMMCPRSGSQLCAGCIERRF
jgi:hypothetical protein